MFSLCVRPIPDVSRREDHTQTHTAVYVFKRDKTHSNTNILHKQHITEHSFYVCKCYLVLSDLSVIFTVVHLTFYKSSQVMCFMTLCEDKSVGGEKHGFNQDEGNDVLVYLKSFFSYQYD